MTVKDKNDKKYHDVLVTLKVIGESLLKNCFSSDKVPFVVCFIINRHEREFKKNPHDFRVVMTMIVISSLSIFLISQSF